MTFVIYLFGLFPVNKSQAQQASIKNVLSPPILLNLIVRH